MFRVTTVHLTPDARRVDPTLDRTDLGDVSRETLLILLERFRDLDGLQAGDQEPELIITSRTGKFVVRNGRRRLFLYNARDRIEPYAELEPMEIVRHLERTAAAAGASGPADESGVRRGHGAAPHRGIATTILIAGLALNGYTLYSVFYTESVNEAPTVTLLTDPAEITTRMKLMTGTFATGTKPGDRTITVSADGRIQFAELGSRNSVLNNADTCRVGRRDKRLCLTTLESGVIDILDNDTLVYYKDHYRRR